jgi:hypothetical protein
MRGFGQLPHHRTVRSRISIDESAKVIARGTDLRGGATFARPEASFMEPTISYANATPTWLGPEEARQSCGQLIQPFAR